MATYVVPGGFTSAVSEDSPGSGQWSGMYVEAFARGGPVPAVVVWSFLIRLTRLSPWLTTILSHAHQLRIGCRQE